jgi:hypothetical protein
VTVSRPSQGHHPHPVLSGKDTTTIMATTITRAGGSLCPVAQHGGHRESHLPQGCRCLTDAAPTHQFIQSLAAIGWPLRTQGRLLGCHSGDLVGKILRQATVTRHTARRVAHLWDRLWTVPGPSPRTVTTAARRGWDAPDPEVVARLVADIDCPHTSLDRDQAARVLARRGLSVNGIALRLHMALNTARSIVADSPIAA